MDPNLPLKGEVWLEVLMPGHSAALDLPIVSCPVGISVQCDGVQGSVNSPGFFSSFEVN